MQRYIVNSGVVLSLLCVLPARLLAEEPSAWEMLPEASELKFEFQQLGDAESGRFRRFTTTLRFEPNNLAASRIDVQIQMGSVDTHDQERDAVLRSPDLFHVERWPVATFAAGKFRSLGGDHYQAEATLTIRDQQHKLPFPFSFTISRENKALVGNLRSDIVVERLAYGVGQGDWLETDWVANKVRVKVAIKVIKKAT